MPAEINQEIDVGPVGTGRDFHHHPIYIHTSQAVKGKTNLVNPLDRFEDEDAVQREEKPHPHISIDLP